VRVLDVAVQVVLASERCSTGAALERTLLYIHNKTFRRLFRNFIKSLKEEWVLGRQQITGMNDKMSFKILAARKRFHALITSVGTLGGMSL
jgi:hypothetical protein